MERAFTAIGRVAELKPTGLSWALLACVLATGVVVLLALILRPQIDDDAAFFAAAAVFISVGLLAERFDLWPRPRPIIIGLWMILGCAGYVALVNGYWFVAYVLTKSDDPDRFLLSTNVDALLAFDNRWCKVWMGHVWSCKLKSDPSPPHRGFDPNKATIAQNERVLCWSYGKYMPGYSRVNYGGRCRAELPRWCREYWNGRYPVPNREPMLMMDGFDVPGTISDPEKLRALDLYPGKCIKTIWGF
ncbi:MAG: hypothetical protein R3D57_19545 [Hyphomicrobiaceae bacterium]